MTLSNALASSPTGMVMRNYNDLFTQVVTKSGGSFYVLKKDKSVTTCAFPFGSEDTWQIMLVGPTYAAVKNFSNSLQVA